MAHPWHYYIDPALAYEMAEGRTCQGCVSEDDVFGKKLCLKGKDHGHRCKSYREKSCQYVEPSP